MEFDPSKYSSTSFDSNGPAEHLIELFLENHKDFNKSSCLRIVDLGCGPGNSSFILAKYFPKSIIYGLDIDQKMIDFCKKINTEPQRIKFFVQDLNLSFEQWNIELKNELFEKSIDLIYSNYALQWINDPKIICKTIKNFLKPNNGFIVANILYSDIYSVIDNEQQQLLIDKYMEYPNEQKFISDWLLALKNQGEFYNISLKYWQPCSIYPENYYKQFYVKIPLKWHEKFIKENTPEEIKMKISEILKNLILKKRIKRIIPRNVDNMNGAVLLDDNNNDNGHTTNDNSVDDMELNDIEIQQQLWSIIVRH